jgi:vancomycin aglycone glucosyltransferase
MRVLLSTIGSRGDVQPLLALAMELKGLGQQVKMCVPPDFRDWIESFGISVTPIGPELRTLTASKSPAMPVSVSPERRRELAAGTVATQFETVAAAAEGCDMIVAATALQIAARSVAERMRIPYVFATYCPVVLPSSHHAPPPLPALPGQSSSSPTADNRELWARDAERFNDLFGPALNSHRESAGLAAIKDVRNYVFTDHPWLAADPTLAPWPGRADGVFQSGAWILRDERPLAPELEAFLADGEPPIYFGFGSIRAPANLSEVMIKSARALGRRAIVSSGWAELSVPDDESDCLTVREVNQQVLFTRVAAVVHHGGAGTTTTAALAGAPQVVIPQMYDQHYWAQRIHDLGIGIAHAAGAPTMGSLTSALDLALQSEVAARARSIAPKVRTDGARIAALRLTKLAQS